MQKNGSEIWKTKKWKTIKLNSENEKEFLKK